MGQRHQLFVIARLLHKGDKERKYRCIVAMHHQWLYGRTALCACKATLDLVRNKWNAKIVEAELATIAAMYTRDSQLPANPAPFLSWMLLSAISFRPEEEYASSRGCVLDPNMGSHEGDNNDGITVFDVTNPMDPAYCFVSIGGLEAARETVKLDTPLTAEQYVREYYPPMSWYSTTSRSNQGGHDAEVESEIIRTIESFKGERLVERWMLREAWPMERYGRQVEAGEESSDLPDVGRQAPEALTQPSTMPTLSELSLRKGIDLANDSGDTSGLDVALSLPGVGAVSILNMLAERDSYSDTMLAVLIKALRDDKSGEPDSLDLSPYALTSDQIFDIMVNFASSKTLHLSGRPNVDRQALLRLLPVLPKLSRLNLYSCDGLSPSDLDSVRSLAPQLEAVYHNTSMRRDADRFFENVLPSSRGEPHPKRSKIYPPLFTFYFKSPSPLFRRDSPDGFSLMSYSPRQVVIALHDFHKHLQQMDFYADVNATLPIIFSSLSRSPSLSFKDRAIGTIPGSQSLATEGWLYAAVRQDQMAYGHLAKTEWGFVKYRFSKSLAGDRESQENDGAAPTPASVDVVGLEEWLKRVDPQQTVEGEWVERLGEKLKALEFISKDRAMEIIREIPMCTV